MGIVVSAPRLFRKLAAVMARAVSPVFPLRHPDVARAPAHVEHHLFAADVEIWGRGRPGHLDLQDGSLWRKIRAEPLYIADHLHFVA